MIELLGDFLQQFSGPYFLSFITGLMYGFTACSLLCVPYIITYVAGVGKGFRGSTMVSLTFSLGRIAAYSMLGGLIGAFKGFLNDPVYQTYTFIIFSTVIVLIGINLLLRKNTCTCPTIEKESKYPKSLGFTQRVNIQAFLMGFTKGLMLCPPLVVVLLYSAAFFSQAECIVLAFLFGLGTTLSPLLFFGGAVGWLTNLLSNKAPLYRGWIPKISGGILVLMGVNLMLNALFS